MLRPLVLGTIIILAALPAVADGDQPDARVVRLGIIGVEPFAFMDGDQPAGLFVDLCRNVVEQQGWRLRCESVSWDRGLRLLAAGELDLIPSMAYSAARDSLFDFSDEHVTVVWSQVYRRPGERLDRVTDLEGRRVAVMRSDLNAENFRQFAQRFDVQCDLVEFTTHEEALAAVAEERAAVGVAPNFALRTHAEKYGLVPSSVLFSPFPVYFATTEGSNGDLLAALDDAMRDWRADDDSYYHHRVDAWLGAGSAPTRLPAWTPAAVAGFLLAAVLLVLWNRSLERRVRRRTSQLADSERRFRAVFESAGDAVFLMHDGRFILCNQRTLEMFRGRRDQIIGQRPEAMSPDLQPDGRPSRESVREHVRRADTVAQRFEWRHRRCDGTEFDAEVTLNSFRVGDDQLLQASVRDITHRKHLETSLRQAQKMEAIGTLAGGIAHDFNNILAAIMGYNELARQDAVPESEQETYLARIGHGAERARDLVEQILAFSRQAAEVKRPVELAPVLVEALKLLRSSIPTTIEIRQQLDTAGRVLADPTSLHQIVMNLGTNAYQAMAETGGVLDVHLREVTPDGGRLVELVMADNGPGMSPDVVSKIFEPYFTTKSTQQGTGLGLAVVHGIIEDHEGTIEVESEPGRGTTFRVRLPSCERSLSDTGDAGDEVRPAGGERVLLVDDERPIVDVFQRGLTKLGYRVAAFQDPQAALDALTADPRGFDVLVTDVTMPGLTGEELTTAALALNPDLPVLMCTGYSDTLTRERVQELGARDLVSKPVDISQLAHRIRMVLAGMSTPRI